MSSSAVWRELPIETLTSASCSSGVLPMSIDAIDTSLSALDESRRLIAEDQNRQRLLELLASRDRVHRAQDSATALKVRDDRIAQQRIDGDQAVRADIQASTLDRAAEIARTDSADQLNQLTEPAATALRDFQQEDIQIGADAINADLLRGANAGDTNAAAAVTAPPASGETTAAIQTAGDAARASTISSDLIVAAADLSVHAQANQDPQSTLKLLDDQDG